MVFLYLPWYSIERCRIIILNYGHTKKISRNIYKSYIFSPTESRFKLSNQQIYDRKLHHSYYLKHNIMPRQLYPGQYTFHILDNKAKQIKQRSATRIKVAKLRERHIKEQ